MKSDEEYEAMVSKLVNIRTALVMWSIMQSLGFMLGFGFGILMGLVL